MARFTLAQSCEATCLICSALKFGIETAVVGALGVALAVRGKVTAGMCTRHREEVERLAKAGADGEFDIDREPAN